MSGHHSGRRVMRCVGALVGLLAIVVLAAYSATVLHLIGVVPSMNQPMPSPKFCELLVGHRQEAAPRAEKL